MNLQAFRGGLRDVVDEQVAGKFAVLVVLVQCGVHVEVVDADGWKGHEGDFAEDAAEPPHVLVFEIRRVAPLEDADLQRVLFDILDNGCDIEFGDNAASFAHADELAVQLDFKIGVDAAERQDDAFAVPFRIDGERAAIDARGIFVGHVGRIRGERQDDVRVLRLAETGHLPVGRHLQRVPRLVVFREFASLLIEKGFRILRAVKILEQPFAVERLVERRQILVVQERRLLVGERRHQDTCGQAVDFRDILVFPIAGHHDLLLINV